MEVTGKELVTPKITEQYPENRATLEIPERFRAELTLKYDAAGRHKCIACGICQMNCPNGTIKLTTKMVDLPDGKKKRKLDKYMYDLGSCTFACFVSRRVPKTRLSSRTTSNRRRSRVMRLSSSSTIVQKWKIPLRHRNHRMLTREGRLPKINVANHKSQWIL